MHLPGREASVARAPDVAAVEHCGHGRRCFRGADGLPGAECLIGTCGHPGADRRGRQRDDDRIRVSGSLRPDRYVHDSLSSLQLRAVCVVDVDGSRPPSAPASTDARVSRACRSPPATPTTRDTAATLSTHFCGPRTASSGRRDLRALPPGGRDLVHRGVVEFEATLGWFAGDGLMVWLNDPLPCPDPAARAVRLAVAMRDAAAELKTEWRKREHELG